MRQVAMSQYHFVEIFYARPMIKCKPHRILCPSTQVKCHGPNYQNKINRIENPFKNDRPLFFFVSNEISSSDETYYLFVEARIWFDFGNDESNNS